MTELKLLILIAKEGGIFGAIGLIFGLLSYPEKLSVLVVFKYSVTALIAGSIAYHIAKNSKIEWMSEYKILVAISISYASFFIIKGVTAILMKFSKHPIKTFADLKNTFRGGK